MQQLQGACTAQMTLNQMKYVMGKKSLVSVQQPAMKRYSGGLYQQFAVSLKSVTAVDLIYHLQYVQK